MAILPSTLCHLSPSDKFKSNYIFISVLVSTKYREIYLSLKLLNRLACSSTIRLLSVVWCWVGSIHMHKQIPVFPMLLYYSHHYTPEEILATHCTKQRSCKSSLE